MRLRVDLAYDGGPFRGFARQPGLVTVQGTLEDALGTLLGQDAATTCAGRTDRGVHATAQVVHLDVDTAVGRAGRAVTDLERLRDRLDTLVGEAVTIWAVEVVAGDFDARFSATERSYRYRVADRPALHPLRRYDTWHLGEPLAIGRMRAGARHLVGEHDFASFCRKRADRTTERRLDRLTVSRGRDRLVHVRLSGRAFCHQQVRSIVGCLVDVGRGRREPGWIAEVLAARDRAAAAAVAPPEGLTLERVSYGRRFRAAPPPEAR